MYIPIFHSFLFFEKERIYVTFMVIGNGLLPYFYLVRKADLGYICNLLVYTYLMNDIQIFRSKIKLE